MTEPTASDIPVGSRLLRVDPQNRYRVCAARVEAVIADVRRKTELTRGEREGLPADRLARALNMRRYLAFRSNDLRDLQQDLAELGLSSLGRAESRPLEVLERTHALLRHLLGEAEAPCAEPIGLQASADALQARTLELFGDGERSRHARILVTLPSQVAANVSLLERWVAKGMDAARINCAHDGAPSWAAMASAAREAGRVLNRRIPVMMDLAGPKVRTGEVDETDGPIHICEGDLLELDPSGRPGRPAGRVGSETPARIGCTLPELFGVLAVGQAIWFDDGKIGGVVEEVEPRYLVRITRTRPGGRKLRAEKSVNVPEADLPISALTQKDREDLESIVRYADLVALSFVRSPSDLAELQEALEAYGRPDMPVVLKIETQAACQNLPQLLLQAMRRGPVAVMIARGDLAVEVGFERMAELQEEILWLCEAAGVPVIWATQVLERLAKTGIPARAEVTDAASSERADVVMLNKGPYIDRAIATLDDILSRMEGHQHKKRSLLRRLTMWD